MSAITVHAAQPNSKSMNIIHVYTYKCLIIVINVTYNTYCNVSICTSLVNTSLPFVYTAGNVNIYLVALV